MASEIKAPQFPESIVDGIVAVWHKRLGEPVVRDELLVDIETDKVVLEVVAPADGCLKQILKTEGETIGSLELLALFDEGAGAVQSKEEQSVQALSGRGKHEIAQPTMGPAARRMVNEYGINPVGLEGTGKNGRLTKEDVIKQVQQAESKEAAVEDLAARPELKVVGQQNSIPPTPAAGSVSAIAGSREERRVPMTRLRARIAERLMQAKNQTAMLTTFNEVNMKPAMDMRKHYRADFEKHHGVKLGFMSFFVRASVEALKRFPAVNASIDGNDVVYHGYYDIGVAVSTDRGLVVPILRDADQKNFAEIEQQTIDFSVKARDGKLALENMMGGTFTLSNGGVFGSLLSTPIINPPQTAILGMHKIQDRPVAVDGQVVILPMMYLALSYDHRLIDGKEAVQFLATIKDFVEDPARLLLDI